MGGFNNIKSGPVVVVEFVNLQMWTMSNRNMNFDNMLLLAQENPARL